MDLHPERNIIVLGSETSKLLIYDTLSSYYIATITLKMNTGVKSVRFSPGLLFYLLIFNKNLRVFFLNNRWVEISCRITKWKCLYI
jgi:hypothetical protein